MIDKRVQGNSGGQGHTRVCRGAGEGSVLKSPWVLVLSQLLAPSKLLSKNPGCKTMGVEMRCAPGLARAANNK